MWQPEVKFMLRACLKKYTACRSAREDSDLTLRWRRRSTVGWVVEVAGQGFSRLYTIQSYRQDVDWHTLLLRKLAM